MNKKDEHFLGRVEPRGGVIVPSNLLNLPPEIRIKYWKGRVRFIIASIIFFFAVEFIYSFGIAFLCSSVFFLSSQYWWFRKWTRYINLNK